LERKPPEMKEMADPLNESRKNTQENQFFLSNFFMGLLPVLNKL